MLSGRSIFVLDYMSYTMYRPSGDVSPLITITNVDLDSVCGNMQYILFDEEEVDAMARPVGDSYFTE